MLGSFIFFAFLWTEKGLKCIRNDQYPALLTEQAWSITHIKLKTFCFWQATRVMDEEERQDTQMRERFTTRWTPKPSAELTVQLRQEADKYRGIMENAVRADAVVREKYNTHRRNIDLLSKGEVR